MTERFAADKHRLGMYYIDKAGFPFMPVEQYPDDDGLIKAYWGGGPITCVAADLVRAPEHDLVPIADVKALLEALQLQAQHDNSNFFDDKDRRASAKGVTRARNRALAAFTQKHGE